MGYALRHIGDLRQAFSRIPPRAPPGGKLCPVEITCPRRAEQAAAVRYMKGWVPCWRHLSVIDTTRPSCGVITDTIEACLPPAQIVAELEAAGFKGCDAISMYAA